MIYATVRHECACVNCGYPFQVVESIQDGEEISAAYHTCPHCKFTGANDGTSWLIGVRKEPVGQRANRIEEDRVRAVSRAEAAEENAARLQDELVTLRASDAWLRDEVRRLDIKIKAARAANVQEGYELRAAVRLVRDWQRRTEKAEAALRECRDLARIGECEACQEVCIVCREALGEADT